MYRIGIDVGGTKINIGIFETGTKRLIAYKKSYVRDIVDLPEYIKVVVNELCERNSISLSDIVSCGIGIPGTVSDDGKKIIKAPNINILSDDIVEKTEATLNVPVKLVQDSRAAAWGNTCAAAAKVQNRLYA